MIQYGLTKVYETFRHDIPNFFKNVYRFRRELYKHQWYDYTYTLDMLQRSLIIMEKGIREKGSETYDTQFPKLVAIRRAITLLENKIEDNYIEMAEYELGPLVMNDWKFEELESGTYKLLDNDTVEQKKHNSNIYKRAREIENKEWSELWDIFKGTKNSTYISDNFDGCDIRGWWD